MTIHLSDKYPKIIRDLFLYDKKGLESNHKNLDFPFEYNVNSLYKEAITFDWSGDNKTDSLKKIDRILLYKSRTETNVMGVPAIQQENNNEEKDIYFDTAKYPEWNNFLKQLISLKGVLLVTMSKMMPGGFIYPHKDSNFVSHKIYFPLNWPQGCYFKIYKHGLVDFSKLKPKIINSGDHIHSVINDSQEERIIVSIFVDWNIEPWKMYLKEHLNQGDV